MNTKQIPIIDTDTHVTEPADLWTSRISTKKWGDQVLHVKWDERKKMEYWCIGEKRVFSAWGSANWQWKGGPLSIPPRLEDIAPSSYEANARLKVMDDMGIYAQVLYPNLGAVLMSMYSKMGAPELMLESVRAYNDFLVDFISPAPERFVAMACLPLWDVQETVKEIQRVAKLGHKGLVLSGAPQEHGWPYLGDRIWDPVWSAIRDTALPVSFHCGGGDIADDFMNPGRFRVDGLEGNYVRTAVSGFLKNGEQLTDLLCSGVLPRYPEIKFAIVESGIGFIPFVLEAIDYHFKVANFKKARPEFKGSPSDYFREQVYVNYWFENLEPWHTEKLGVDNLLFETDFPHTTCLNKEQVQGAINNVLSKQSPEAQEKILWKNAAKLYNVKIN